MTTTELTAPDPALAAALDLARTAAVEVGGAGVGEHLAVVADDGAAASDAGDVQVATHAFASGLPGYVGWYWAVTVARAGDAAVTVDEVVLLPGADALLAPAWVPWEERVRPGDLSPGELLPTVEDDVRLVPAYTDSGDPAVEALAFELGVGRESVLSRDGRLLAAERWYEGERGPDAPMARQAPGHCGTCGFFVGLAGSLRGGFGVCANEHVDTDGQVVSVEYGCGAHSQVRPAPTGRAERGEVVYDDGDEIEPVDRNPDPVPSGEATVVPDPVPSGEAAVVPDPVPEVDAAVVPDPVPVADADPDPDRVPVADPVTDPVRPTDN